MTGVSSARCAGPLEPLLKKLDKAPLLDHAEHTPGPHLPVIETANHHRPIGEIYHRAWTEGPDNLTQPQDVLAHERLPPPARPLDPQLQQHRRLDVSHRPARHEIPVYGGHQRRQRRIKGLVK